MSKPIQKLRVLLLKPGDDPDWFEFDYPEEVTELLGGFGVSDQDDKMLKQMFCLFLSVRKFKVGDNLYTLVGRSFQDPSQLIFIDQDNHISHNTVKGMLNLLVSHIYSDVYDDPADNKREISETWYDKVDHAGNIENNLEYWLIHNHFE